MIQLNDLRSLQISKIIRFLVIGLNTGFFLGEYRLIRRLCINFSPRREV